MFWVQEFEIMEFKIIYWLCFLKSIDLLIFPNFYFLIVIILDRLEIFIQNFDVFLKEVSNIFLKSLF